MRGIGPAPAGAAASPNRASRPPAPGTRPRQSDGRAEDAGRACDRDGHAVTAGADRDPGGRTADAAASGVAMSAGFAGQGTPASPSGTLEGA